MGNHRARTERNAGQRHPPKAKFAEQRQNLSDASLGFKQIRLTHKQQQLAKLIQQNDLIFVEGPAGSGKSLGVLYEFVKQYLVDNTREIVIIRTPVEAGGDKIGYLPDDLASKIAPHFSSAKKLLEDLLSPSKVECDLGKRIKFLVPNYVLGSTLDNALIFIDEAQQMQPLILKLLMERIGKNSVCVVAGDRTQLYTNDKQRSGLTDAVRRFFREDQKGLMIPRWENVEHMKFEVEDVQRSEIVKTVIKAYSDMQ